LARSAPGEFLADQRQPGGEHGGAAEALQGARRDQGRCAVGRAAQQGGEGEHPNSGDEHALAAEPVS
jgi:hypothetical protein